MEALSGESLAGVMNRCHQYTGYQAAILFRTSKQLSDFTASIRAALKDGEYGIKSVSRGGVIRFSNGSLIRPYAADTAKREPVCVNEIITDEVSDEDASGFLRLEIYHCCEEVERNEEPLDDFLGSFKVYKA